MFTIPKHTHTKLHPFLENKIVKYNYLKEYGYIFALAILFCGIISILTYSPKDASPFHFLSENSNQFSNYFGEIGAAFADWSLQLFGIFPLVFFVFLMIQILYNFRNHSSQNFALRIFGYPQMIIFSLGFLSGVKPLITYKGAEFFTGGVFGENIFYVFEKLFDQTAALAILFLGGCTSLTLCLGITPIFSVFWVLRFLRSKRVEQFSRDLSEDIAPVIDELAVKDENSDSVQSHSTLSHTDQNVFLDLLSALESNQAGSLKSVLMSNAYQKMNYHLPLICGNLPAYTPFILDLVDLQNLFITANDSQEKQNILHILMMSLLFQKNPIELKLVLVDPQMCDLAVYDGIGHLLFPILTSPHRSVSTFNWVKTEVENRYQLFKQHKANSFKDIQSIENLPYIVVLVGELRELMQAIPYELEKSLQKISYKSHFVGIHLIFATSYPDEEIIPTSLSAIFPNKIKYLDDSLVYVNDHKSEYVQTQPIEISKEEVYTITRKLKTIFTYED